MSQQGEHVERGYLCTEDLSAKRYFFMKYDATGNFKAKLNDSSGGIVIGPLQEAADVSSTNEYLAITVAGFGKVKLGGTVDEGGAVMSNGSGEGIAATSGNFAWGIAQEAGVDGDVIEVLYAPHYAA